MPRIAALDDHQPASGLEPLTTAIADSLSPVRIISSARCWPGGEDGLGWRPNPRNS
jgi:hypothetical protein